VATQVSVNANEAMVAPMVLAQSALGGSLESGGRFYVEALGRNVASRVVKMFLILQWFTL
jgi:hypothetical protein